MQTIEIDLPAERQRVHVLVAINASLTSCEKQKKTKLVLPLHWTERPYIVLDDTYFVSAAAYRSQFNLHSV